MKLKKILFLSLTIVGFISFLLVSSYPVQATGFTDISNVFVIVMENHSWSAVKTAPYITQLQQQYAHAEHYSDGGLHPSEPNYIWLEAGSNFGVTDDSSPGTSCTNSQSTPHLVQLLNNAGVNWKAWQEGIPGTNCPLSATSTSGTYGGNYAPKHLGPIFFKDVTGNCSTTFNYCITHIRPYSELNAALNSMNTGKNYNFITPNLCDDMHDCSVTTGDTWLSNEVPKIINSPAFAKGVIFITWDEGSGGTADIGMIVVSPFAKKGYASTVSYPRGHSSLLRTIEEIYNVSPFLNDAANRSDLLDLFNFTGIPNPTATTGPNPSPTPTSSANSACSCQSNNTCSSSCAFKGIAGESCMIGSTTLNPFTSLPTVANKTAWCNNPQRAQGDANGDGVLNDLDYYYFVRTVNGGQIPPTVNPDFNGDGEVGLTDRGILVPAIGGH